MKIKSKYQKEIMGIKEAFMSGTLSYELKYNVEVEKKLMGMKLVIKNNKLQFNEGDVISMNKEVLLSNIDKVHTTEMGIDRIKRNLKLDVLMM